MTIVQTLLVFVGIPAAIIAVLFVATFGRSMVHQPNRYRPGKAWDHPATWYVPHPDAVLATRGERESRGSTTAVGGASGEW